MKVSSTLHRGRKKRFMSPNVNVRENKPFSANIAMKLGKPRKLMQKIPTGGPTTYKQFVCKAAELKKICL